MQLPEDLVPSGELKFLLPSSAAGTLGEVGSLHNKQYLEVISALNCPVSDVPAELWTLTGMYQLGGVQSFELLPDSEITCLSECYKAMYPGAEFQSNISSAVYKYSQFKVSLVHKALDPNARPTFLRL